MQSAARLWLGNALWCGLAMVPAIVLAWAALQRLPDEIAMDRAIPVPNYMIAEVRLPRAAYQHAVQDLERANPRNADAQFAAAEAVMLAGGAPPAEARRLIQGLSDAPASPRGWLLLSEALAKSNPRLGARALSQALLLAPYDYWLAGRRARAAAEQWSQLDAQGQALARRQVQIMWEEVPLRPQIRPLLATDAGLALVAHAFEGRASDLRALNRWVSRARRAGRR